jgi:hypothetical protein
LAPRPINDRPYDWLALRLCHGCYFAGAIATELSHDALKVNPFIPIVLLWIGAFIRDRSIFF